jgi:threonine dehydratase
MMDDLLKRVLNARVAEVLPQPTPLQEAPIVSARLGVRVWLKREDLTPVFSFKLRGAYNRIARLSEEQLARGVIAASAGNHAQGVAYACRRRGSKCRIVMPRTTPTIKVAAVRSYGADIELFGDSYSDAATRAQALALETGMVTVHPFDDPDIIAGQGTIGLEILRQAPLELQTVFVPVGGGGLASGVAAVIKELRPEVRVIGVQASTSQAMRQSLAQGSRVALPHVGIFADGVAVKQVGQLTLELCQRYLDGIVSVEEDELCAAIKDGFGETRTIWEPAGALALAGLKALAARGELGSGVHVAVASGANISFSRLAYVSERAELGEQQEALLCVTIPEKPGSFLEFCQILGQPTLTEFNYRLASRSAAHVFVGLEVSGVEQTRDLLARLGAAGFPCDDLSHDDLAKTHVRHMVGGVAPLAQDEVLYTFEFPERPGALCEFLARLGTRWNISLFHYRNHGAGFGRVLCGLEVPAAEHAELDDTFRNTGFAYQPVPSGPVTRFLRAGGA